MAEKRIIVCFGPGPQFKGGIANYNSSLALALDAREDTEVHIVSWTQQYPAIVPREFVDKSSKSDVLANSAVKVHYLTNYNQPSSWKATARLIASLKPEKVIFQWSIAIQGLPIGRIIKALRKLHPTEIVMDLHFVIQKEGSVLDKRFTRLGISEADTYIVHALKTYEELKSLYPRESFDLRKQNQNERKSKEKVVLQLFHPVYTLFKPDPQFDKAGFKSKHGLKEHVFLFFGFIRKYKGLHHAIEAFAQLAKERDDVSLLICGESFWNTLDDSKFSVKIKKFVFGLAKKALLRKQDDERDYRPLDRLEELGISDRVMVVNDFIPNEDVHLYFQASDAVLLFYEYATPSGIESMSYNFGLPILATRVGHFPEVIQEGVNGYLAESENVASMKEAMSRFLSEPIPSSGVHEFARSLSWENYAGAILNS